MEKLRGCCLGVGTGYACVGAMHVAGVLMPGLRLRLIACTACQSTCCCWSATAAVMVCYCHGDSLLDDLLLPL